MPKPINKTWGHCRCRVSGCNEVADIRRMKSHERGAQYLVCPAHGPDKAQGAGPQSALDDWIAANTIPDGAEDAPEALPVAVPEPEPMQAKPAAPPHGPERKPEPGRGKGSAFFDWVGKAHQEFVGW